MRKIFRYLKQWRRQDLNVDMVVLTRGLFFITSKHIPINTL